MYSGFAFHRHLLTGRGRGKTHTMLTGDIGQLRFYTTKLTAEENKQILRKSDCKGSGKRQAGRMAGLRTGEYRHQGHAHHRVARNDRQCSKVYL